MSYDNFLASFGLYEKDKPQWEPCLLKKIQGLFWFDIVLQRTSQLYRE
jgi:hypothetical protein